MTDFCTAVHPLSVLRFVRRFTPLLIIPLLRGMYTLLITGAFIPVSLTDIAVAVLILSVGTVRYKRYSLSVRKGVLTVCSGLFIKRKAYVPLSRLSGVYVYTSPYSKIFGASLIKIDTDAGNGKHPDFEFYYRSKSVENLIEVLTGTQNGKKDIHRCSLWQTVLLSLSEASALSGLLVAAGVIRYLGKLLGDRLDRYLLTTISAAAAFAGKIVPPAAALIAWSLAAGFLISFFMILIKHLTFSVETGKYMITVSQGVMWRKRSYIVRSRIGGATESQPPVMRLFGRGTLLIHTAGYEGRNGESQAIIPVIKVTAQKQQKHRLTQPGRTLKRVFFAPTVWAVISWFPTVAAYLFNWIYVPYLFAFSSAMTAVILYIISIRLTAFRQGGADIGDHVRLSGTRFLTVNRVTADLDRIDCITVSANPFDRRLGLCRIDATLDNRCKMHAVAKNLDCDEVCNAIKRFGTDV